MLVWIQMHGSLVVGHRNISISQIYKPGISDCKGILLDASRYGHHLALIKKRTSIAAGSRQNIILHRHTKGVIGITLHNKILALIVLISFRPL